MNEYNLSDFINEDELDSAPIGEILENDSRSREEIINDALYSDGAELFFEIQSLSSTLQIVNTNYRELCKKRNEFIHRGTTYWLEKDIEPNMTEYLRLLHNYSASVHTLRSHSYTFIDRHEDEVPDLRSRYSNELLERDLDVKAELLNDLRHYMQKYWQIPLSASISVSTEDDSNRQKSQLVVDRDELLEWDQWDDAVEEYLKDLDEKIDITEIAQDYQKEIDDFYQWFKMVVLSEFYEDVKQFITADLILSEQRS